MPRRELYEEGLFYYIHEFVEINKGKADEAKLKLLAHKKWPRLTKAQKQEYQRKAKEEEEQKTEQQKELDKEQEEVEQEPEAPINKKNNQRGKRNTRPSPKPNKGRQKKKAPSVDDLPEEQVVEEKRGRSKKQNGEPKSRARTAKSKQQKKQEQKEQDDKDDQKQKEKEEQELLKQHISAMAKSKVDYQQANHKDHQRCDILHLKKYYDLQTFIQHYQNAIKDKKNNKNKNKKKNQ